jgi:ribosomal protein S18 acetylase RimI-like enzyme
MAYDTRILGPDDQAVLRSIAPDVFDHALQPGLVAEFLSDDRHHMAVAVDEGVVVGFASGVHYVHPDKPAELWINEVGVAPSHQGRGIGKAVVRTLLQHGKRLGCGQAWVLTDRANLAAMRLYASAGGREHAPDSVMFEFSLDAVTHE